MNNVAELNGKWAKVVKLGEEFEAAKADFASALNGSVAKPKVAVKRTPKKKTTQLAPASADGTPAPEGATGAEAPKQERVSLKKIVKDILAKNSNGLDLGGIVAEVHGMVERKEYVSNAKSLSAVVSQAVTALKQEDAIVHDRESKKYSLPTVAA